MVDRPRRSRERTFSERGMRAVQEARGERTSAATKVTPDHACPASWPRPMITGVVSLCSERGSNPFFWRTSFMAMALPGQPRFVAPLRLPRSDRFSLVKA